MAETVYVLGAGINMVVRHRTRGVRPPLARNFFQELHSGLQSDDLDRLLAENRGLYEYIEHYWKLDQRALSTADFDLEECYTLLEQHEKVATEPQDYADYHRLWEIKGQLTAPFSQLLEEITSNQSPGSEGL